MFCEQTRKELRYTILWMDPNQSFFKALVLLHEQLTFIVNPSHLQLANVQSKLLLLLSEFNAFVLYCHAVRSPEMMVKLTEYFNVLNLLKIIC